MRSIDAARRLRAFYDRDGRYLYTRRDLAWALFGASRDPELPETLQRLLEDDVLAECCAGVYEYRFRKLGERSLVEDLAVFLRRGRVVYESFESAASRWSVISQIPVGRIMCATTGEDGLVELANGFDIEYVHVERGLAEIVRGTADREPHSALRLASKELCVADLIAEERSVYLIDWEEVYSDD